jgi:hypothetical protein
MIHFEGTLTPEMYRRALGGTGRWMQVVAWMLILASVVNVHFANLAQPVSWATPLFFATVGVMLLLAPRFMVKQAFATDRMLSGTVTGEADEQGMRVESAHGRADLPWALMHKVMLTPDLVVVFQSASICRIFSRQFFADEESWQAFRRLAAAVPSDSKPSKLPWFILLLWAVIVIVVFIVWTLFTHP